MQQRVTRVNQKSLMACVNRTIVRVLFNLWKTYGSAMRSDTVTGHNSLQPNTLTDQ